MSNLQSDLARQQLAESDASFVVLHPHYGNQRGLMWNLVDDGSVYVRFDGETLNHEDAHNQLQYAVSEQTASGFDSVRTLILDECDRVDMDALDEIIEYSAEAMLGSSGNRIVVCTRQVPRFMWKAIDRSEMTMLPVDEELMLCNYIREKDASALLEVHAFGQGRVLLNGNEITQWDGHLPRALFFYVVDRGMTTRSDIFEVFWPTLPVREATNVFHVTKRKINEVLGIDLTAYWSGFYRISPEIELVYDVMNFSRMVQDADMMDDAPARNTLQRAISLYRGEFLSSMDSAWVQARRGALLQTYGEALVSQARISADTGEAKRALGLYLRSALTNPQREDLVGHIMTLYSELEMYADALAVYDRLVHELGHTLDVEPTPQIQSLATSIREKMH